MNIVKLHQLIDQWAADERAANETASTEAIITPAPEPDRVLPEGKRVVRTKSQGDKVFFLDEVKKTRQWIAGTQSLPGPEIVDSLGFTMGDVEEVEDGELLKYQMASPIYKLADGPS